MEKIRTCKRCFQSCLVKSFGVRSKTDNRLRSYCKDCERQIDLEYRDKNRVILKEKRRKRYGQKPRVGRDLEKLKISRKKAHAKYVSNCPFKIFAHKVVRECLRKKLIVKPNLCEMCLKEIKLEAHHNDYTKPLDIKWICRHCHLRVHGKLRHVDLLRHTHSH